MEEGQLHPRRHRRKDRRDQQGLSASYSFHDRLQPAFECEQCFQSYLGVFLVRFRLYHEEEGIATLKEARQIQRFPSSARPAVFEWSFQKGPHSQHQRFPCRYPTLAPPLHHWFSARWQDWIFRSSDRKTVRVLQAEESPLFLEILLKREQ